MIKRSLSRRALVSWILLVVLRLLVALTSTSSIHPDEHFQNPEIAAADVFGYPGLLRTWEWLGDMPCRSIVPVWGSTGLAFSLLRLVVGDAPSGRALFVAQRLWMWMLSLVVDYSIWTVSSSSTSLLLFASSPITVTFLLRPFSNSLETILLAIIFLLAQANLHTRSRLLSPNRMAVLGAVSALGVWTRITFVAFACVPLLGVVVGAWLRTPKQQSIIRQLVALLHFGAPAILSFVLTATLLTLADTLYFASSLSRLIVTPLNLLRYNLDSANLAEHGLHPHYLHLAANWPMLFGVGIWAVGDVLWKQLKGSDDNDKKEKRGVEVLYLLALAVPTIVLSLQPHQEPRFLIPLVTPLVLLVPSASFFRLGTTSARRKRRAFWSIWIVHSVIFTALFGCLHQGGLIPALLTINDGLRTPDLAFLDLGDSATPPERLDVVFWKTFMPPRHLLIPMMNSRRLAVNITDLSGSSLSHLISTLQSLRQKDSATLLFTPAYLFDATETEWQELSGGELAPKQLFEGKTFGVHVDMDRLDQLVGAEWDRMGVGVWQL